MKPPRLSRLLLLCAAGVLLLGSDRQLTRPGWIGSAPRSHACRFWGLIGSGYPRNLLNDQLRAGTVANLRTLGGANRDGWGLASYLPDSARLFLNHPIVRRGGPPANDPHDPDYDLAVDEMIHWRPRAALGHVRAGSSGHWGIPNPHPFEHEGLSFAHNGTLPEQTLAALLTHDDADYLENHPPDYVNGYIDSELYFLYLLKYRHQHPSLSLVESLHGAVQRLAGIVPDCRLNFVMTDGDTLYALRCSLYDDYDPVRYCPSRESTPDPAGRSPYWVVASQILGSDPAPWGTIPRRTLAVFVPGQVPEFIPVDKPLFGMAQDDLKPAAGSEESDRVMMGPARPNPTRGDLRIPIRVPSQGAEVRWEIWDAGGRSVRAGGPVSLGAGNQELIWDGRDAQGVRAPNGTYFCRLQAGAETFAQRFTVIR
jgi:predicted glutamine amidotransferase